MSTVLILHSKSKKWYGQNTQSCKRHIKSLDWEMIFWIYGIGSLSLWNWLSYISSLLRFTKSWMYDFDWRNLWNWVTEQFAFSRFNQIMEIGFCFVLTENFVSYENFTSCKPTFPFNSIKWWIAFTQPD